MPEKETIISKAKVLEISSFEPHLNPEQIWKVQEQGAEFELIRGVNGDDVDLLQLIINGELKGKHKIETDFIRAFGIPERSSVLRGLNALYLDWTADKVLEALEE